MIISYIMRAAAHGCQFSTWNLAGGDSQGYGPVTGEMPGDVV